MTTPTPETDAFSPGYDGIDWPELARKLERERDGALELLGGYKMDLDEARERNLRLVNDNIVLTKDRDAWKAKAERTCKWTFTRRSQITGRCNSECGSKDAMVWLYDPQFGYVFCPFCGGRIVKEEE